MSDTVDLENPASSTTATNGTKDCDEITSQGENQIQDLLSTEVEQSETAETRNAGECTPIPVTVSDQNETNMTRVSNASANTEKPVSSEREQPIENALVVDDMLQDDSESAKFSMADYKNEKSDELLKESPVNDSSAAKENIDKLNTLNDDLIFVKPKDKDRGHCYWYALHFFLFFIFASS